MTDRHGMSLAVSTHAANRHKATLMQLSFEFYNVEAKPDNLIGNRTYDSNKLDEALKRDGLEMIVPHRSNRKKRRIASDCDAMNGIGLSSASLPGFSGTVVSSSGGSTTPRTSSVLSSG